jgi:hypothetical protein
LRGKLTLLNLCLLALLGVLGWQLRREWLWAQSRDRALLARKTPASAVPGVSPLGKIAPLAAATYADVANNNLFSKDRNPNIILDPPPVVPPKPQPPLPVARGVMLWEGAPPTVVLSQKGAADQKGYHPGDTIGEYKILAVDNKQIIFEWDGKKIEKRLDELMDRNSIETAPAPAGPVAQAGLPAANQNLNNSGKAGPGADMGGGNRACVPGDGTPAGTVVDGLKKTLVDSPFAPNGKACYWQPAK